MQIEYIWIVLAVVLLLLELWAINIVLRSTGGWGATGLWVVAVVFVARVGGRWWVWCGSECGMVVG
ncbi:hypothetical protein, partial [Pseudomonas carnis]|uniref:hypothetical protein n=1 Tax=Pseudomonas carnis TaxID=2487355 RepID=UPI001F43B34B